MQELEQLEAAAVVTTLSSTSLSQVFYDGRVAQPARDKSRGIAYTKTHLEVDHALAWPRSPASSRPCTSSRRRAVLHGGTRLNTPIKPAIDLGATHLIVVALHSPRLGEASDEDKRPDLVDGASS